MPITIGIYDRYPLKYTQALQMKIFPDGISVNKGREFRTIKLSPSFETIKVIEAQNGKNVTPPGFEPGLLG